MGGGRGSHRKGTEDNPGDQGRLARGGSGGTRPALPGGRSRHAGTDTTLRRDTRLGHRSATTEDHRRLPSHAQTTRRAPLGEQCTKELRSKTWTSRATCLSARWYGPTTRPASGPEKRM